MTAATSSAASVRCPSASMATRRPREGASRPHDDSTLVDKALASVSQDEFYGKKRERSQVMLGSRESHMGKQRMQ